MTILWGLRRWMLYRCGNGDDGCWNGDDFAAVRPKAPVITMIKPHLSRSAGPSCPSFLGSFFTEGWSSGPAARCALAGSSVGPALRCRARFSCARTATTSTSGSVRFFWARYSFNQRCGTVTIFYASGSDFWKAMVPVPVQLLKSYGSGSGSNFWKVMVPVPVPTFEKVTVPVPVPAPYLKSSVADPGCLYPGCGFCYIRIHLKCWMRIRIRNTVPKILSYFFGRFPLIFGK